MTWGFTRKHTLSISWPIHNATNPPAHALDVNNSVAEKKSLKRGAESNELCTTVARWGTEISSSFLACLAMMAIVVTLATHNSRTLPDWRFGITVNALVSVFATIWKAAMLQPVSSAVSQLKWSWFRKPRPLIDMVTFDEASRGTMGSLWLIGRLRAMHLASLGAAICVLSLATDPFIQQVVKFENCPRTMENATASIPRTNVYADYSVVTGAGLHTLGFSMQAALYNGAYNSFSQARPTCTSGNCTFTEYRSIGMCGGCTDVSKDLSVRCHSIKGPPGKACQWRLPSGLNLTIPNNETKVMVMRSDDEVFIQAVSHGVAAVSEIISLTSVLEYNKEEPFPWIDIIDGGAQNLMGLQCALWPCVRTYTTSMTRSQAQESVLTTHNMTYNSTDPFGSFVSTPMPCLVNDTYYEASAFTEENATNTNEVFGLLPKNESAWLPDQCIFAYTNPLGLFETLPQLISGHASASYYGSYARPPWMGQLFHNDSATVASVQQTWLDIADAMTVHMRKAGMSDGPTAATPPANAPAIGQVWETQTCIAVQWQWLAYPAALLALTVGLLVATIVQSARHEAGRIWKASPLALLFHGLLPDCTDGVRDVHETQEMAKIAKRLIVSVAEDGGVGLDGYFQEEEEKK